jgi:hypothetical protein
MSTLAFIKRFRELHDKAKKGALPEAERAEYGQSRTELGRLMLVAQQMSHGGQTLRSGLRMAQLMKVELELGGPAPQKTSTIDLSAGGFAVLLPGSQSVGRVVRFTIHVPSFSGGTQALSGTAKVASARAQSGSFRVSFAFQELAPADREHLEMVLIDSVLARFERPAFGR